MNILLAFKAEPDLSMLAEADWQAAAQKSIGPDPALMRVTMGTDEQGAAELMLLAKEANPALNLHAVTLGDERALPALRHLAALGFARQTLLHSHADTRFHPAYIAELLAAQVRAQNAGLVLLGSQSSEGQNGQTGWLLAEMLGWPCLSQVNALHVDGEGFLVQSENPQRRSQWRVQQPVVLRVQNRGQLALRGPGMRARLASAKAEVTRIPCNSPGADVVSCMSLERHLVRRCGIILDGTIEQAAQRLWREHLAQRMK
ncbi:electron transfer flavoprotein subunit beta/FixA family protein [Scandinavium lactucae]|uniref:Electron transfer flavoprotein subunit beta/FixA family protein n=1 Tax=Scandinavium lactucae TaxID=3095028 RepID=A0ABU4QR33_9ENTR|nr:MULTISPECIES: electron transfer flavoprotein subunit beta/FixA family protein [unclassified Scandinavium]MDX6041726.1 electron transfer flavoprotein subunit beta/FixA family protein [Scandinavium sp. V105_6]MDX6051361.1 electron transfer flavoprotein subunit beta/FixA family protein [Scandinavium sp. V105_1]